ncbi:uncharacterized protein BDV17DRAFT_271332 [Aspergillus undulatus]|uniref:uncharacterized protein n=1 Tax=Aspergillus undulatus TaxID=1810928 RepID=UPI003CCDA3FE
MFRRRRSGSQHRVCPQSGSLFHPSTPIEDASIVPRHPLADYLQHQHQLSTPNSQSAHSAATRAFAQSQSPSNSLSSAAAAAALRSLTPTPTPVENVQTKRMLQRQSSISSQPVGSPTLRPSSRNGLRRSNSSASMSARTFRDQSPGRPSSSYSTMSTMSTPAVVPPLPSIPAEFSGRRYQSRRSVSGGPSTWSPNSRTQTPEKTRSVISPANAPGSPQIIASSDAVPPSPLHQRSESRNSINFSYPMNSRTNSPVPERSDAASDAATSLNKRSSAYFNHIRAARQQAQGGGVGSSTRSGPPVVTALAAAQAVIVPRNDETTPAKVSPRPARPREQTIAERSPSRSPTPVDAKSHTPVKKPYPLAEDCPANDRPQSVSVKEQSQPAPTKEQSQPTPVKEQPEPAPLKEQSQPVSAKEQPQPAVVKEKESRPVTKANPSEEPPRALTPPVSEKIVRTPPVSPPQAKSSPRANLTAESDQSPQPTALRQSSSPARAAHFPSQLTVAGDQLHQPPPRSVSPAKSAMKNRNSSLSPDGRLSGILRPGPPLSELSDATSVASDDGARPGNRKKSVKVSFDDEAEVVGVAASPPTSPDETLPASPPGKSKSKTNWFGLHKRKISPPRVKEPKEVDEFDGILKPRAALPSFGSIRGNKDGKDGARPETTAQQDEDDDDLASDSDDDLPNGHAINDIISRASEQDEQKQVQADEALLIGSAVAAARDDAGTQEETMPTIESDLEPAYFQKTQLSPLPEVPSDQNLPLSGDPVLEMPDITLQPATPDPEKGRASLDEWDSPQEYPRQTVEELEGPSDKKGKRRSYEEADNGTDSSSSIYSDAEEDFDGDGFGSINAIVEHEPAQPQTGYAITLEQDGTTYPVQNHHENEIPETCQIARVDTPVLEDSKPSAFTSPSLIEPLPVSTISPPHVQSQDKTIPQGEVARSSTAPVEVHAIAHARDDDPKELDTRQSRVESPVPSTQRSKAQQRPGTSAPIRRKEVNSPDSAGLEMNGVGAHSHRRQLSNDSDSESSFRRVRRGSRSGMGMRRTLRGSQQSSSVPASPNRVLAPIDPSPLPSSLGAGTMRTTLRGNSKKEKPSFFSTGKSQKVQKGRPARGPGTSFASRFPDSDSDSDDGVQNRRLQRPMHRPTRSMSDNDMRPVRGIPRRMGAYDGDSTELEDSSDGERRPSSAPRTSANRTSTRQTQPTTVRDPALAAVAKSRGMTEDELEQLLKGGSGSSRKPNILNRLSMKKSKPVVQRGKLQSELLSNGTIPEHSDAQGQDTPVTNGNSKSVGNPSRLLKKSLHKKSPSGDTWPLGSERTDLVDSGIGSTSSPSASTQPARTQTPDGGAVNGNKADSQLETSDSHRAADVGFEGGGRKKRFSRLKKAFGIRS